MVVVVVATGQPILIPVVVVGAAVQVVHVVTAQLEQQILAAVVVRVVSMVEQTIQAPRADLVLLSLPI